MIIDDSERRGAFVQVVFSWYSGPQVILRLGTWKGPLLKRRRYEDGSRAWRIGPVEIGFWY